MQIEHENKVSTVADNVLTITMTTQSSTMVRMKLDWGTSSEVCGGQTQWLAVANPCLLGSHLILCQAGPQRWCWCCSRFTSQFAFCLSPSLLDMSIVNLKGALRDVSPLVWDATSCTAALAAGWHLSHLFSPYFQSSPVPSPWPVNAICIVSEQFGYQTMVQRLKYGKGCNRKPNPQFF